MPRAFAFLAWPTQLWPFEDFGDLLSSEQFMSQIFFSGVLWYQTHLVAFMLAYPHLRLITDRLMAVLPHAVVVLVMSLLGVVIITIFNDAFYFSSIPLRQVIFIGGLVLAYLIRNTELTSKQAMAVELYGTYLFPGFLLVRIVSYLMSDHYLSVLELLGYSFSMAVWPAFLFCLCKLPHSRVSRFFAMDIFQRSDHYGFSIYLIHESILSLIHINAGVCQGTADVVNVPNGTGAYLMCSSVGLGYWCTLAACIVGPVVVQNAVEQLLQVLNNVKSPWSRDTVLV